MKIEKDEQLIEIVELLKRLGYDLSKEESKIFVDLVIESLDYVSSGKSINEVYELINDKKKSPLYVELAYFIYEKGMPHIHNSLERLQPLIKENSSDKELYKEVFEDKNNLNAYDAAFCIVKHLDKVHTTKKRFVQVKNNHIM